METRGWGSVRLRWGRRVLYKPKSIITAWHDSLLVSSPRPKWTQSHERCLWGRVLISFFFLLRLISTQWLRVMWQVKCCTSSAPPPQGYDDGYSGEYNDESYEAYEDDYSEQSKRWRHAHARKEAAIENLFMLTAVLLKGYFAARCMSAYWEWVTDLAKMCGNFFFFKLVLSSQGKKAETVFYTWKGEKRPNCTAVAAFRGHTHCFPAKTGVSTRGHKAQPTWF